MNQRLPWHKPEMMQLIITLDTAFEFESGADGLFAERVDT